MFRRGGRKKDRGKKKKKGPEPGLSAPQKISYGNYPPLRELDRKQAGKKQESGRQEMCCVHLFFF